MSDDEPALTWAKGICPLPGCQLVEDGPFAKGGSGEVWRAVTPGGFRLVLKRVRLGEKLAAEEVRAMKLLPSLSRHPHLLEIRDVQCHHGELIVAMEEAEASLKDRLAACRVGGLRTEDLLPFMRDAAEGIDHLNRQNIQHRDIKPDNLMIVGGRVKVGDFGLAKVLERTQGSHSGPMTPAFAAPEWRLGFSALQSDQYSLAVSYYYLRTGRLPPDLTTLWPKEATIVARALSYEPSERWPNCVAFVEALEEACLSADAADPTPVLQQAETLTRKSLLDQFRQLNPRSQLGRLLGLIAMPIDHRPSEILTYAERVDRVLDWAEQTPGGFEVLDARIREILAAQQRGP